MEILSEMFIRPCISSTPTHSPHHCHAPLSDQASTVARRPVDCLYDASRAWGRGYINLGELSRSLGPRPYIAIGIGNSGGCGQFVVQSVLAAKCNRKCNNLDSECQLCAVEEKS